MSKALTNRPRIPKNVQARVFFRDKCLCCHWCVRPTVFAPALKHLRRLVESKGYHRPTAYCSAAYRRDASPLLDELAVALDHVKARSAGGGIARTLMGRRALAIGLALGKAAGLRRLVFYYSHSRASSELAWYRAFERVLQEQPR
jgi:hypothetical protein